MTVQRMSWYKGGENLDKVAWDRANAAEGEFVKKVQKEPTCCRVAALVAEKLGKPGMILGLVIGGLNAHYRVRFGEEQDSSSDIMVRVPWSARAQFPNEKVLYEAAAAEYVRINTRIPVPQVLHYGPASSIGPFLMMRRIENQGDFTNPLNVPGRDPALAPALNPGLPESKLRSLWGSMAWCLLELTKPTFSRIGSLLEVDGSFQVARRPLTLNMGCMKQLANIPTAIFPDEDTTFATADEWYVHLATMHLAQLIFQHNDLVANEDDCRNKYVSRQLFLRLARQGRLSTFGFAQDNWSAFAKSAERPRLLQAPNGSKSFRLWCDDLRPANVLLGLGEDDTIASVIDWEFTYAAPAQFALDPPWWLLLAKPEMWRPAGVEGWSKAYEPKLEIWLKAMEDQEDGAVFLNGWPLSAYMRDSWETGRFWINYAARKSWVFDAVFWTFLDERFFGPRDPEVSDNELWKTRVHLLSQEEQRSMEPFVKRKMDESRDRILVEWDAAEARQRLAELLFD
ncbi:phosphotransferase [Bombardia bombarda]|uniref:Phosphotransferase n=1 Tax=Bombardia bombarda TaxID=252184 RepID=A0AA39TLN4_9PEZI|nr:phosphotransferase [Bombardia bombarda]